MIQAHPARSARGIAALALASLIGAAAPAAAQPVVLPASKALAGAIGYGAVGATFTAVDADHPLPVGGRQESLALVIGNAPAAPATVFGGDYVFAQTCSGYGSVALRVRGADGATMQAVLSKTSADTAGGTGIALGSGAVVDAAVSGTTGCSATLSRIP